MSLETILSDDPIMQAGRRGGSLIDLMAVPLLHHSPVHDRDYS